MGGKKVLEIGLGDGSVSKKIAEAGAQYYGLDISPESISLTQHRFQKFGLHGQFRLWGLEYLPFPQIEFDYIIAENGLHRFGDLQKLINECYISLLAGAFGPGGTMIFRVSADVASKKKLKHMCRDFRKCSIRAGEGSDIYVTVVK